MKTVTWKFPGIFNADAAKVAEEIGSLGENVTPEQIVNAARTPGSELHKCFTWNDGEAAEKWRKHEARRITHFLVIREEESEESVFPSIRAFWKNDSGGYKPATLIFKKPDEYQKLLATAMAELRAFKEKYSSLQELSEILALID